MASIPVAAAVVVSYPAPKNEECTAGDKRAERTVAHTIPAIANAGSDRGIMSAPSFNRAIAQSMTAPMTKREKSDIFAKSSETPKKEKRKY